MKEKMKGEKESDKIK